MIYHTKMNETEFGVITSCHYLFIMKMLKLLLKKSVGLMNKSYPPCLLCEYYDLLKNKNVMLFLPNFFTQSPLFFLICTSGWCVIVNHLNDFTLRSKFKFAFTKHINAQISYRSENCEKKNIISNLEISIKSYVARDE